MYNPGGMYVKSLQLIAHGTTVFNKATFRGSKDYFKLKLRYKETEKKVYGGNRQERDSTKKYLKR